MESPSRDISPELLEDLYQHYCEMERHRALHLDVSDLILSVRERDSEMEGT